MCLIDYIRLHCNAIDYIFMCLIDYIRLHCNAPYLGV